MKVIKSIVAGDKGSKRFLKKWGDQLLRVRYREDEESGRAITTLEIIVEERAKLGKNKRQTAYLSVKSRTIVGVQISIDELELRARVKAAGANWDNHKKLWLMSYDDAITLALKTRIEYFD